MTKVKGDPEILQESSQTLTAFINSRSAEVLNENRLACRRYASDLITQLFGELNQQFNQQLLPNGLYDLSQLDSALQEVTSIYDSNALDFGPSPGIGGTIEKALLFQEARAAFLQDLLHQVGHQLSGEIHL